MADGSWSSLVAQEVQAAKSNARELWPVLRQCFRSKSVALRVLRCLVSPYAQHFLNTAVGEPSEVVNNLEDFSVNVRLRRVNPWFIEWSLHWPDSAMPSPNEDIRQDNAALRATCESSELSAVICDRGDFVPRLLDLLTASRDDAAPEARETQDNFRSAPPYLYKYVVRLLFLISEPLHHLKDPRFSTNGRFNAHLLRAATPATTRIAIPEELTETRLRELAHPWMKEAGVVVEPTPVIDTCEDMDCIRLISDEPEHCSLAARFVAWNFSKNEKQKLCYLFVCPEEPELKKDGWRKAAAVEAAGWVTHPLRRCSFAWPEELEGTGPVDVRSMCCVDVPIYRRMIHEVAKPAEQLKAELGAMNVTDYRSFLLKALDYFAD